MTDIFVGVQFDTQEGENRRNVHICTKSKAVLKELQSMTRKSKLYLDCHNTLNTIAEEMIMKLCPLDTEISGVMKFQTI